MKKIFSFKSFMLSLSVISIIALLVSIFANINFIDIFLICLGAGLVNGLIIMILDD